MSRELHLYDLDETVRRGSLIADLVRFCATQGYLDISKLQDPAHPSYAEVPIVTQALIGKSKHDFQPLLDHIESTAIAQSYPQILSRIRGQYEHGDIIAIASHGHDFLVDRVVAGLKLVHYAQGSRFYTDKNGLFNGEATLLNKREYALHLMRSLGGLTVTSATGDSIHDKDMLELALEPLAFNPDGELEAYARQRGWRIEYIEYEAAQNMASVTIDT